MENRLLKITEAAKVMGVSVSSLRRWEKEGKISSVRTPGGHRRYRISDIEKFQRGEYVGK